MRRYLLPWLLLSACSVVQTTSALQPQRAMPSPPSGPSAVATVAAPASGPPNTASAAGRSPDSAATLVDPRGIIPSPVVETPETKAAPLYAAVRSAYFEELASDAETPHVAAARETLMLGLPAVSADGRYVLLDVTRISCCIDSNTTVEERPVAGYQRRGDLPRTWLLTEVGNPSEPAVEQRHHLEDLLNQMKRRGYRSLSRVEIALDERERPHAKSKTLAFSLADDRVSVTRNGQLLGAMRLPKLRLTGYCCGDDTIKSCELLTYVESLSVDDTTGLVVVRANNNNGPDGCEDVAKYLIRKWSPKAR
jgi:hypothetical protein